MQMYGGGYEGGEDGGDTAVNEPPEDNETGGLIQTYGTSETGGGGTDSLEYEGGEGDGYPLVGGGGMTGTVTRVVVVDS